MAKYCLDENKSWEVDMIPLAIQLNHKNTRFFYLSCLNQAGRTCEEKGPSNIPEKKEIKKKIVSFKTNEKKRVQRSLVV